MDIVISLIVAVAFGILWGKVTQNIIYNKGYENNWFWWGFWFGVFAVIVACTKPQLPPPTYSNPNFYSSPRAPSPRPSLSTANTKPLSRDDWQCSCGRSHPPFVTSCVCGKSKLDAVKPAAPAPAAVPAAPVPAPQQLPAAQKAPQAVAEADTLDKERAAIAVLKEYKSLLDSGILTQEEFDSKKKQLLGL